MFFRFTMDTFCYIAFGMDLHSLEQDSEFAHAFDRTQKLVNDRFESPVWKLFRFLRTGSERELDRQVSYATKERKKKTKGGVGG